MCAHGGGGQKDEWCVHEVLKSSAHFNLEMTRIGLSRVEKSRSVDELMGNWCSSDGTRVIK